MLTNLHHTSHWVLPTCCFLATNLARVLAATYHHAHLCCETQSLRSQDFLLATASRRRMTALQAAGKLFFIYTIMTHDSGRKILEALCFGGP
jgi:hypothetical protein